METEKQWDTQKIIKLYNQRSICLLTTIFYAQTSPWSQLRPHENQSTAPAGQWKSSTSYIAEGMLSIRMTTTILGILNLKLVRCLSSHSSWVQEHLLSKNRGQVKIGFVSFLRIYGTKLYLPTFKSICRHLSFSSTKITVRLNIQTSHRSIMLANI